MQLKAEFREAKTKTEKIRQQGLIPGVLYGENIKNVSLSVNEKEFAKVLKEAGESQLIGLEIGKDKYEVLIHDTALDPLTDKIIHIDFYKPSTKKKVETEVEIIFVGDSPAVKDFGGILMKEMHQIKVKALAVNLPKNIEVDVSCLKNIDDKIDVSNLPKLNGVEYEHLPSDLIAHVIEPRKEKEEKQPEPSTAETPSQTAEAQAGQAEKNG